MDYIKRDIDDQLMGFLRKNKVLLILGPRRVGKTMMLKKFQDSLDVPYIFVNGEDISMIDSLKTRTIQNYKNFMGDRKLLIIDEAQHIPDIGMILKLMVDSIDDIMILATGSSAFDILNKAGEPLTGRKIVKYLYPFSESEFALTEDQFQRKDNLQDRLVLGSYPELSNYSNRNDKIDYLRDLVNSYLLKDILILDGIRNSSKIFNLLRLVAFQVGSLVSYSELASSVGMSSQTVEKYLDLLSKVFILHNVQGFSSNLRKEITKNSKWYFLDNGIRNILAANMNPIGLRDDIGILWENYVISERIKYQLNNNWLGYNFFWRTYDKQEIDWIEQRDGGLYAYEFKWNSNKNVKIPGAWSKQYPDSSFNVINPSNYFDWVTKDVKSNS